MTAAAPSGGVTRASRRELLAALVGSQKCVNVKGLRLRRRHSHLCDGGAKHVCYELVEVLLRVEDIDTVEPIVSNPRPVEQAALTWMRSARNGAQRARSSSYLAAVVPGPRVLHSIAIARM